MYYVYAYVLCIHICLMYVHVLTYIDVLCIYVVYTCMLSLPSPCYIYMHVIIFYIYIHMHIICCIPETDTI